MYSSESQSILRFLEEDFSRVQKDYGVTREEYNEMLEQAWKKFNDPLYTVSRRGAREELKAFYLPFHQKWVDRHNQLKIEAAYDYQI